MLNLPIYLYSNTLDVILDLDATIQGVNKVMYTRDLTIQKGIKNQIRIQFKNSDQKKVPILSNQIFIFSMFDTRNQRLIVEKTLQVLDDGTLASRGLALLTLTESDTIDLDRSSYQYSVKLADADGTFLPTYVNSYYGMAGTLFISNDVLPTLQPSQEVVKFQASYNSITRLWEYKSGNLYSYPEFNSNSALHTAAFYMTKFKGTVYVQATLNNTPASFGNYVTVATRTYNKFSGVDYVNFNGIFSFVRVMYVPALSPAASDNNDTIFAGTFDKVQYRS